MQQGIGDVFLGNNITANGGPLSFESAIELNANTKLTALKDLILSSSVIGVSPVEFDLESIDESISVGQLGTSSYPLGKVALLANNTSSLGGIVTENGDIDIRPPILLTSLLTVLDTTAGTGSVIFRNTVDSADEGSSAQALQISAGASNVTFLGALGDSFPLGGVQVSSTGEVTIAGNISTTSSSASSLTGAIQINGLVTLSGDSLRHIEIDTTKAGDGAAITFTREINGNPNFTLSAGQALITFASDIGASVPLRSLKVSSASAVAIQSVTVIDAISISSHITLSETPLTTFTSEDDGDIFLGSIDGTYEGFQSLTVATTGTGEITLGSIGSDTALGQVMVTTGSETSIHSINTTDIITITTPIVLLDSATLTTNNAMITLGSINAATTGGQSLSVNAGSAEVLLQGDIGTTTSPSSLDITGSLMLFDNASVFTEGSQQYNGSIEISEDIVFQSKGNITFNGMLDPVSGAPNLSLYLGGGTLIFADSVGDAPFGDITVYNAGGFVGHKIFANTLTVSGGLPVIYLEDDIVLSGKGALGSMEAPFF